MLRMDGMNCRVLRERSTLAVTKLYRASEAIIIAPSVPSSLALSPGGAVKYQDQGLLLL